MEEKLYWSARYGRVEEAQSVLEGSPGLNVLLKDPRVDVTLDDHFGCTALWYAIVKVTSELFSG